MKKYNGEKYIVSFTSFGQRFEDACKMIYSLQKQTYKNFHLCITIWEGDLKDITPTLELFIDNDLLEVIVAPENLCPHLKYFYAMKKYWDKPIITVDDDRIYSPNSIENLIKKHEMIKFKSVISNCAICFNQLNGSITDRTEWPKNRLPNSKTSFTAMAEGFAAVLYPPECFSNLDSEIENIKQCLYDDDLFLRTLEIRENIPVTQADLRYFDYPVNNGVFGMDIRSAQKFALATHGNNIGRYPISYRKELTAKLKDVLLRGFELNENSNNNMYNT